MLFVLRKMVETKELDGLTEYAQDVYKYANVIHGEERKMYKLIQDSEFLHLFSRPLQHLQDVFQQSQIIDCSFIWTHSHAKEQVWHMDSLDSFYVCNVLINSNIPTEFLNVEYKKNCFQYDMQWPTDPKPPLKVEAGDAICFMSDTIHRGPCNTSSETRLTLYLTFANTRKKLTTDYTYPNWAWIDAQFEGSKPLKRSDRQIDFFIANPHLVTLYPLLWFEDPIRESIALQIQSRLTFMKKQFPHGMYWIEWEKEWYLAHTRIEDNQVVCHYYVDQSIETMSQHDFHLHAKKKK